MKFFKCMPAEHHAVVAADKCRGERYAVYDGLIGRCYGHMGLGDEKNGWFVGWGHSHAILSNCRDTTWIVTSPYMSHVWHVDKAGTTVIRMILCVGASGTNLWPVLVELISLISRISKNAFTVLKISQTSLSFFAQLAWKQLPIKGGHQNTCSLMVKIACLKISTTTLARTIGISSEEPGSFFT